MSNIMNAAANAAQRTVKNNQVPHNITGQASTSLARRTPQDFSANPMAVPTIWDGSTATTTSAFPGQMPVDATSQATTNPQFALAAMRARVAQNFFGPNALRNNR